MKFGIICDYRENFRNYSEILKEQYNDHANQKNIQEILTAINSLGYECEYFGGVPELIHAVDQKETFENYMFLNFSDGMDQNYSRVQAPALLDILGIPYSGSDVFASALMNNKHFCKLALCESEILMPKSCIVNEYMPLNVLEISEWKYPLFVKPNCEGSSLGISSKSVCHNIHDVVNVTNELLNVFDEIIIEEYIHGIDITNYIIGNPNEFFVNDIVLAELFNQSPFAVYDIQAKQKKLRRLFFNEEKILPETVEKIKKKSEQIVKIIGVKDICRIDYRLNMDTQDFYFIEINSAPRFSSTSEIGFIAQKRGITFTHMVEYYLNTFMKRIKHP